MCARVLRVRVHTHTHTHVTHTVIENNFTVCVERKREMEKGTKEEPATDRWGKGGPACERARGSAEKKNPRARKKERQGDRRGYEGERRRR